MYVRGTIIDKLDVLVIARKLFVKFSGPEKCKTGGSHLSLM